MKEHALQCHEQGQPLPPSQHTTKKTVGKYKYYLLNVNTYIITYSQTVTNPCTIVWTRDGVSNLNLVPLLSLTIEYMAFFSISQLEYIYFLGSSTIIILTSYIKQYDPCVIQRHYENVFCLTAKHTKTHHTYLARRLTVIMKAVPLGWGPSIALRLGWSLLILQMWVSRLRNFC